METVKKIIKVGNSNAVVIPANMLKKLHLTTGDEIVIHEQDDTLKITKSKLPESFQDALTEALDKYHDALEDLRKGDE
ncbi:hypothetical protein YK48G_06010 [Lentilactobacillus fungorum]|uniref:SpoVT-AbrB domain-containing protein n=1 Tax=Lentilactobacillus fungorum TaxID=2201250 RepID=A0ABQ3VXM3_9LACO|nr:AbrB/MazE/SpoVT family DNA-binding domain-containing protein [Lentilactobacillus fungorum]GHP13176.1 hypothetical protein YK48G_06010 [Lentilactobacillus fungorum]